MFLPRKGPITVITARMVQASLGQPDLESSTAKDSGSWPLRPMASMIRLVAPKKEFMGPMGPRVAMMSITT